ncbi:Coenzyme F420 hydrogenase/dehydrogenase, beta subunit C-terminal domain [Puniceibacterium confluentis]|uniref:Coenzyme F420 hydrogenase/dehydrogenase, beta subunit C-terminal domain n=1 Tax=Puniceibacterium confluentis TaxID=1958944 RepID=UPI0011B71569|nr:Coenzyme F420 hydrogenase/dehydrogenase, beta subunit C-terminal domain [Puniceibacterium confluentis]
MPDTLPPAQSAALARVARGSLCAGCGACAALAPGKVSMTTVAPGYLRPEQSAPLSDSEEAGIAAVCPGLGQSVAAQGRPDPVLWGPYREMVTGWARDPALRFAGASGGALSMMLAHLLTSGTVEAVVQVAADPDLPIGNATVVSSDLAAITRAAGSRYAPSAPLADLPARMAEHAATGRRFAFVGKPCDAAALRALCRRDPAVAAAFPVILSFFCAGVPSHAGGAQILAALGTDLDHTAAFRFRGNGWPGRATATDRTGHERSMSYHDSWGRILSKHVQHRCKICADGTGVAADIVCADAWESDAAGYPVFAEAEGVSLIVARTELGARLLAEARAAGQITTGPFDIATLAAIQPGQRERRRALFARLLALRLTARPVPRYRGLQIAAAARQNPLARNVKNFLGTLRRALRPSAR